MLTRNWGLDGQSNWYWYIDKYIIDIQHLNEASKTQENQPIEHKHMLDDVYILEHLK